MATVARLTAEVTANTSRFESGLKRANSALSQSERSWNSSLNRSKKNFDSIDKAVTQLNGTIRGLAGIGLGALGASTILDAARSVVEYSDNWKQLEGRLKVVTNGMDDLKKTQDDLFKIAEITRQPLENVINLYTRLNNSIEESERANYDLLGVTTTISKALAVTGESAASSGAAILQFSQAVSSDFKGSAQEINSLLDSAPRLAVAIQKSFGDGSKSLKQLAEDGDLSRDAVLNALSSISGQAMLIGEEFDKSEVTVSQALTRLENSFLRFIGQNDNVKDGTSSLANVIIDLAGQFDTLSEKIDNATHRYKVFMGERATKIDFSKIPQPEPSFNQYSPGDIQAAIDRSKSIEVAKQRKIEAEAEKQRLKDEKAAESAAKSAAKSRIATTQSVIQGLEDESQQLEIQTSMYGEKESAIKRALKMAEIQNQLAREGIVLSKEQQDQIENYLDSIERQSELQSDQEKQQKRLEEQEKNRQQAMDQFASTIESHFEDAILSGEKLSDVLQGLLEDIAKILLRTNVTAPLLNSLSGDGGLLSGIGGALFGGLFGSSSSGGADPFAAIGYNTTLPAFATGTSYVPRDMIARVHKGEEIVPASQAGKGMMAGTTVIINNNNGSRVTQTERQGNNGAELLVMIDDAVAKNLSTSGTKTNQALKNQQQKSLIRR